MPTHLRAKAESTSGYEDLGPKSETTYAWIKVSITQGKGSYDYENFTYLKFCFSMLPVFIHEAYTETIIVHFLSDLKRP